MIKLENVSKLYRNKNQALEEISFEIERGEFVFLVGPSGSGKSTLLRLINRQEKASSGLVYVAGKNVGRLRPWRIPGLRRTVGCVFQDYKLLPSKTTYENVAFALVVQGKPKSYIKEQVQPTLEMVGLGGKARDFPSELSGGEQQRVAIARAFVNRPLILLADEPTGNLDPETSQGIMQILERISGLGTTVLMATHESAIVDTMKRRVIQLSSGHLVRDEFGGEY